MGPALRNVVTSEPKVVDPVMSDAGRRFDVWDSLYSHFSRPPSPRVIVL